MPLMLGRKPKKFSPKTLTATRWLSNVPPPPGRIWREWKVPANAWGAYGNLTIGDCTLASKAHTMMMMTAHTGTMFIPEEADIIAAYSAISGYDPNATPDANGNNPTDTGCAMTDVLNYWQTTGIAGHKILAWAAVNWMNPVQLAQSLYIFGCVDVGVNLPNSAMDQTNAGKAWDVVPDDGGIAGGHDVPIYGEGSLGNSCVTWGARQEITNAWVQKYIEEAYVVITEDWLNHVSGLAPNMLDLDALNADLAALRA